MPARSKIALLPPEIKAEFDKRLISGGFSNYTEVAEWLCGQGIEISRSSAHRYGKKLENTIASVKAATDMAVALTDQVGDDAGKMSDAVIRMYQEKLFNVLLDMNELDPDKIDFNKLGRVIADITRSSVSQKKWAAEMRKKTAETAEDVVRTAKTGGLSEETAEQIRRKILGIV